MTAIAPDGKEKALSYPVTNPASPNLYQSTTDSTKFLRGAMYSLKNSLTDWISDTF